MAILIKNKTLIFRIGGINTTHKILTSGELLEELGLQQRYNMKTTGMASTNIYTPHKIGYSFVKLANFCITLS